MPYQTKPMCSIASRRLARLCTKPQRTVSHSISAATGRSTIQVHAACSIPSSTPWATGAPIIATSSQDGRNALTNGTTLAVKNGIIRWQTVTNTGSRKAHRPAPLTHPCAAGPNNANAATTLAPTQSAPNTRIACSLSSASLARMSR